MRLKVIFLLMSVLLWSGCSSPLEVMVAGQSDMNSGGNAADVRIYELSGDSNFTNTPRLTFWRDDKGALGGELINNPRNIRVGPNQTKTIEFDLSDDTQFIGIAADLSNPEREQWRFIYSVDEVGDRVTVTVHSNRISVEAEGGLPLIGAVVQ